MSLLPFPPLARYPGGSGVDRGNQREGAEPRQSRPHLRTLRRLLPVCNRRLAESRNHSARTRELGQLR